ncbi:FAD-dependent oxidoreductase [Chloroflexota bacterium]
MFQPIKLGALELPNRIIMPAVNTLYDLEGDERLADFYAEIARGGAGLIILGSIQALYPGRREPSRLTINQDDDIPRLKQWTKAIHDNGGRVFAHLAVWSHWAKGGVGTPGEDVSPSGVDTLSGEARPEYAEQHLKPSSRPLTGEEIHQIEEQLGDAAVRAATASFDGIELACQAGNIINRFITPYTNRRNDEYGGSLPNRLRMLLETIAIIKKRVGTDFPFICRIPGDDLMPWGLKLKDSQELAPLIEKAGIHGLNIMPGWYESKVPRHQMCVPRGAFVHLAEGIKQVVNIPVAAGNNINEPRFAEQVLAENRADLIAMGRPLMADPELPNKARSGHFEDIRLCTTCCTCWDYMAELKPIVCAVNARSGQEAKRIITPAKKPGRVLVIGAGPGGMEAARVAAIRGHRVTLITRGDRLGGELLAAALPPYKEKWLRLVTYLATQLDKLNVAVRLNEEATASTVVAAQPDVVIVATGATPLVPDIPGIDGPNVATAISVLIGEKGVGQNVVVAGGGLIGCETAELVASKGKRVTILEKLSRIGDDIGMWNRWVILDRLARANIRMETDSRVEAITESGIKATKNGSPVFFGADSVVLALGMKADDRLARELEGKVPALYKVGDCLTPRRVKEAVEDGFLAGNAV